MDDRVFIEEQFPVSKISKESYKERKAGASQTLTSLGKWWGRKPLVVVRAAIIGMLMPVSNDPKKDRGIFLKIMTMDDDGLWNRRSKSIPATVLQSHLTKDEWGELTIDEFGKPKRSWSKGLNPAEKNAVICKVFDRMSYDEKLTYCDRPEQIEGPDKKAWQAINEHLGTNAASLQELVTELGKRCFGHVPKVGDAFCGGGSIPFEAARLGCEAYGSDLNPVAALLTWAAIHLIGGGEEVQKEVQVAQKAAFEAADKQITEWGIEHNDRGWRADAYLYCVETRCPATGLMLPLAPSWIISEKYRVCAVLKRNDARRGYDIEIVTGADKETFATAKKGTVQNGRMVCPETGETFSIASIRGDRRVDGETVYGLRLWENEDLIPRPDDVFQERLYCVRWVETLWNKTRRHYCSVNEDDLRREDRVLEMLRARFLEWQKKGFIPSRAIERGYNTDQPIRERGWTHWHHLFNPRQLLMHGDYLNHFFKIHPHSSVLVAGVSLSIGPSLDIQARLCGWNPHKSKGPGSSNHVFLNQALNTQYIYSVRPILGLQKFYMTAFQSLFGTITSSQILTSDAKNISEENDIWITDPPYADAINYHELTDFFLAWYEKHLSRAFPNWYTDTKKALAIRGSGGDFKRAMVDSYANLTNRMPDNGLHLVMFTHQDASVWADLAMILWAAGLKVTTGWTIGTETSSNLKQGNYVQGTVLLILRKRTTSDTAFLDELYPEIEDEVRHQLDQMLALDDKEDPNFADTDYQLAAYAAALRVLTSYSDIEGHDIRHELFRHKKAGEPSAFEQVINQAVEIASDHLVPKGLETRYWKSLLAPERLYLKGLELEKNMEARAGAYQELAKGFGVKDYTGLYHKAKANAVRFKTGFEFKKTVLGNGEFGSTPLRNILFAIHETVRTDDARQGLNWLRDEVPTYWQQRKQMAAVLNYLAALTHISHMPHWEKDADAAQRLAGAVENDHAGTLL